VQTQLTSFSIVKITITKIHMRRNLLIVALGITFLIAMTVIGTLLDTIVPRRPSAPVQTAQAGPYQITLQVSPNPPPADQPANVSLQIVQSESQQLVTDAHVTLEDSMETMDMGTDHLTAQMQSPGIYQAQIHLLMSGPWAIHVSITQPGQPTQSTTFEVTAQ
jgi:YtkA-like